VNLIKTSFYTSISTAITFLSGFIIVKFVAVKIGPTGIALVGQFQNSTTIFTLIATAAVTMGVVKYLAQHRAEPEKVNKIISTAFFIAFISSIIISIAIMASSLMLSKKVFHTSDYWLVYFLYGLLILTVAFNAIFSSILNGLKEIKWFTIINICTSLLGVCFTVIGAYFFDVIGVLLSGTATAFVVFLINIYAFRNLRIQWYPFHSSFDKETIKILSRFSLMAAISGFLTPAVQILIRDKIINNYGMVEAGYWQAVTKISDYYLGFIVSVLSVYYMPRLSEITQKKELRKEIVSGYKIILPVVGAIAFFIWLFRHLVMKILFTADFFPMEPLFKFQLLGDFFKIGSWLLAYTLIAKAMTKAFIITEIIFSLSYLALSIILINHFGIIGATYSFCINYALYWVIMFIVVRNRIK